jgi:hypothetical protein
MTSDTPDSRTTLARSEATPDLAVKGQHRDRGRPARIEAGVFLETTASGLMARVLGPGDVIETRGFWVTDGRLSANDALSPGGVTDAGDQRSRALEIRIDCLAAHSSERRVADLLSAIGSRTPEARIGLTQQQFAELTGLRRATINEVFQNLQTDGAVSVRRGQVHITNAAGLAGAACGCDRILRTTAAPEDGKPATPSD